MICVCGGGGGGAVRMQVIQAGEQVQNSTVSAGGLTGTNRGGYR